MIVKKGHEDRAPFYFSQARRNVGFGIVSRKAPSRKDSEEKHWSESPFSQVSDFASWPEKSISNR